MVNDTSKTPSPSRLLKAFLWNSGGLSFYFACKWLLTILVVRFSDSYEDAGYLALAMSLANVFYCLASYNMRHYQVSDIKGEYSDNTYLSSRLLTITGAILLCLLYCALFIGNGFQRLIVLLYMLLVAGETLADVLHGIAQKHWRMDIIGISSLLRGLALLAAFIFFYKLSGLALAVFGISALSLLLVVCYDFRQVRRLSPLRLEFQWDKQRRLLKSCFPLMATVLLYVLYATAARVFLEAKSDAEVLGVYSAATILAVVVAQLSNYIIVPLVNVLSRHFAEGSLKTFNRLFLLVCGAIFLLILVSLAAAALGGAWALRLIFGADITPYAHLLLEALVVTGLTSYLWLLLMVLTIMRKLAILFLGCAAGFLVCLGSAEWAWQSFGISGANVMQMLGLAVAVLILAIAYLFHLAKCRGG
jgi:O-antigen/teichoic acid export membrane protein